MTTDYTKKENWAVFEQDGQEKVDTVYFCPSLVMKTSTGTITGLPEEMLGGIGTVLKGQVVAFEEATNVFVPLYRQMVFNQDTLKMIDLARPVPSMFDFYKVAPAYEDCAAALDYYFENLNKGKPFILAGHSQGSAVLHCILEKYMKEHPDYYQRMVAAYAIGMGTPKAYMEANPHLKYASCENDTGVIISWNTEGVGATGTSIVLCDDSLIINPLNWKTDETYAKKEENLGSLVDGKIVASYADAQIDHQRHALVTNAPSPYAAANPFFGNKCLHGMDYQLFINNIKENVKVRIDAFLKK